MKEEYPIYARGDLEKKFKGLTKLEQEKINQFIKYCSITAGERKLADIKRNIIQFRDIVEADIDKIGLEELRDFLGILNRSKRKPWTQNGIKQHIKKLLRWNFKDWSNRFDEFNDIKLQNAFNEQKINDTTLITPEELENLLRTASSLRDKALITLLYESAARPQEIRYLKWEDVKFNGEIAKITLFSRKTKKSRTLIVKNCVIHLERWKQEWAFRDRRDSDYIFPQSRDRSKPMHKGTLCYNIESLSKKAGIDRKIFPYLLRHSRLNELYKKLPEQMHKKFAGHSKDSRMTAVYSHLNSEDLTECLLETVYGIQEITEEQKNKYDAEIEELKITVHHLSNAFGNLMNGDKKSAKNRLNELIKLNKNKLSKRPVEK